MEDDLSYWEEFEEFEEFEEESYYFGKCPICNRPHSWIDVTPVCCGFELHDGNYGVTGTTNWFKTNLLTPWEVAAAKLGY
jgi:hypothetical protein